MTMVSNILFCTIKQKELSPLCVAALIPPVAAASISFLGELGLFYNSLSLDQKASCTVDSYPDAGNLR